MNIAKELYKREYVSKTVNIIDEILSGYPSAFKAEKLATIISDFNLTMSNLELEIKQENE